MAKDTRRTRMVVVGLDLGDKRSSLCALGFAGEVLTQKSVATTRTALKEALEGWPGSRVVIEAGGQSAWIAEFLSKCGHEVVVANPRRVGDLNKRVGRKNDRMDARLLARLGRMDPELLFPIKHRSLETHVDLAIIRSRDLLVNQRTAAINHCRSSVKVLGERLPACDSRAFVKKAAPFIPEGLQPALQRIVDEIERLTETIRAYDEHIEALVKTKYPEAKVLMQIAGVGYLTALAFILTLEDPQRFSKSRNVGPFLGMVPRQAESGMRSPQLGITKCGDLYLRRLLINSAQYILGPFGPDCDLRRHGEAMMARGAGNAKKRAVTAVARKLSVLMHALWKSGAEYDPLRQAKRKTGCKQQVLAS